MYKAARISNLILQVYKNENIGITSRRLQLILYDMQKNYCMIKGQRLISDKIIALKSGPTIPPICDDYPEANVIVPYNAYISEKKMPDEIQNWIVLFLESDYQHNKNKSDFYLINQIKNEAAFEKAILNLKDHEIHYGYFVEEKYDSDDEY